MGSSFSSLSQKLRQAMAGLCILAAGIALAEPPEKGSPPHLGDTITKAKETYGKYQEWTEFTPGKVNCHVYDGGISILVSFEKDSATSVSYHILGPRARALSPEFVQSHEEAQSKTQWSEDGDFEKGRVMKSEDGFYAYLTPGNYSLILFTKSGFEAYKKESQAGAK